jgi:hypothetical protein
MIFCVYSRDKLQSYMFSNYTHKMGPREEGGIQWKEVTGMCRKFESPFHRSGKPMTPFSNAKFVEFMGLLSKNVQF